MTSDAAGQWGKLGSLAGYTAGACLLGQTALFLADAFDVLGDSPEFHETSAGRLQDVANYYAAYFEHQHDIVWSIIVRDVLGPVAYLALMVAALAALNLIRSARPERQLLVLFFTVGGSLAALSDLVFLTLTRYWEHGGWPADPPANIVAVGRSLEALDNLTTYTQYAGFVVLALGLVCLARIARSEPGWSPSVGLLAYAEAAAVLVTVALSVRHYDTAADWLTLLIGALLGPLVAVLFGRELGRAGTRSPVLV
jgi:uncharacterized membrane protein HdeD (DUF308 family)